MVWRLFRTPPPPVEPPALPPEPIDVPADLRICADHAGAGFHAVLELLHRRTQPQRYFEIGTATGTSLRISTCTSLAVDPRFGLDGDVMGAKPACFLYQATSDAFFAAHDLSSLLGGPIDLAFLDGLHHFEFLLRDFLNTERHCHADSQIVLHDCIPTDCFVARREQADLALSELMPKERRGWWAGDVWKTLAILKTYRPDLTISCFDSPPTGLVIVTGLDPSGEKSRHIPLAEVVAEYRDLTLPAFGVERFFGMADVRSTSEIFATFSERVSAPSLEENSPRQVE